jgi:hypothetical protein
MIIIIIIKLKYKIFVKTFGSGEVPGRKGL